MGGMDFNQLLKNYKPNKIMQWPDFTSTTKDIAVAYDFSY